MTKKITDNAEKWREFLRERYEGYLRASFYFKDKKLRQSFAVALQDETLMSKMYPEEARGFVEDKTAYELATEFFPDDIEQLAPALLKNALYKHQAEAIRTCYGNEENIVVATGTASGKTESFLYPILFELYSQFLDNKLQEPGVRALILYPMNALANDQRRRLGDICRALENANSGFAPSFGQYIGETLEDDTKRGAEEAEKNRLPRELIFRKEMRDTPPHILLTNYSMLEYMLIRPNDSPLFDGGAGKHWQFIVLDEAHQYRGTKGMEMAMLIRRLKQRIRAGAGEREKERFSCIATSATMTNKEDEKSRDDIALFASALFGEQYASSNIIFGKKKPLNEKGVARYHSFMRALEGAFIVRQSGKDTIVLNRKSEGENTKPLEIALCHECGQHYYVGKADNDYLKEAVRDPSHSNFGVDYYLPIEENEKEATHHLCVKCGKISLKETVCCNEKSIPVYHCAEEQHEEHHDQLKECVSCGYSRGSTGDPVREIIHGSDGPNTVIATALHQKQCEASQGNINESRILSFVDSRQEAAFFAWYAEDSFAKIRNRNLIYKALTYNEAENQVLSLDTLRSRLLNILNKDNFFFKKSKTAEDKEREINKIIYRELLTEEKRISLQGVGLAEWKFDIPDTVIDHVYTACNLKSPEFTKEDCANTIQELLMNICQRGAVKLNDHACPQWSEIIAYGNNRAPSVIRGGVRGQDMVISWSSTQRAIVKKYLPKVLGVINSPEKDNKIQCFLNEAWDALRQDNNSILVRGNGNDCFQLNLEWLRVSPILDNESLYRCNVCALPSVRNVKNVCPRNNCRGTLDRAQSENRSEHYALLYKDQQMPLQLTSEEHTAQLSSEEARDKQKEFKAGNINILSSSTTFEVGVDLGELNTIFMRNVPPEPFNYTQRAGRAGRRTNQPGFVLTYCKRNPHDLYHFESPRERIINGITLPPIIHLENKKIISRHITATAFSLFFKSNSALFENVEAFIYDWEDPEYIIKKFKEFCQEEKSALESALKRIVPKEVYPGDDDDYNPTQMKWLDKITNKDSVLYRAVASVCSDYSRLQELMQEAATAKKYKEAERLQKRANKIAKERVINFLSRKAIIPKYGFPVDVVELDTRGNSSNVQLQRDLSQAIAEYAPSSKVVANKKEWESVGLKTVPGILWTIRHYESDSNSRYFNILDEESNESKKYIIPNFGFVTSLKKPKEPKRRAQRLFSTRPYFVDNSTDAKTTSKKILGIKVFNANPGKMVVLCNGRKGGEFYICETCGAGFPEKEGKHDNPEGKPCSNTLKKYALGHEIETDVVRLEFPELTDEWEAYSLAYAVLLGAAQTMQLPSNDLNVTIAGVKEKGKENNYAIILYDNVPGGAGLVRELYDEKVFKKVLENAKNRISGKCGCDSSCYGCLRSYKNQFAHADMNRKTALEHIERALKSD